MELDKITSAIYNDVVAGLSGVNATPNISFEQLEDEVIETEKMTITFTTTDNQKDAMNEKKTSISTCLFNIN